MKPVSRRRIGFILKRFFKRNNANGNVSFEAILGPFGAKVEWHDDHSSELEK